MHTVRARFITLGLTTFSFFAVAVALASVAKYKPFGVPDSRRAEWEAIQAELRSRSQTDSPTDVKSESDEEAIVVGSRSRAYVEQTTFDFGLLDPGIQASHTFRIENRGEKNLLISSRETSCKCTLSETSRELIPPGEFAEVTLVWNTGSEREFYRQYAVVQTNDPEQPEIELAVTGRIRSVLAFSQEEVAAPNIQPGEGARGEVYLYSQVFDDFQVTDVTCGLPGFRWDIEPLFEDTLEPLRAKTGWKLIVSTDASLPSGTFSDMMRVSVASEKWDAELPEVAKTREIVFRGKVHSALSFYGAGLDSREGLDVGVITSDQGYEHRLFVRARSTPLPTRLIVSKVEPAILKAEVQAVESKPGVFALTIRIPKDSPQTIFNREQQHGYVEVSDPDNPRIKSWFPVHGAVIDL